MCVIYSLVITCMKESTNGLNRCSNSSSSYYRRKKDPLLLCDGLVPLNVTSEGMYYLGLVKGKGGGTILYEYKYCMTRLGVYRGGDESHKISSCCHLLLPPLNTHRPPLESCNVIPIHLTSIPYIPATASQDKSAILS